MTLRLKFTKKHRKLDLDLLLPLCAQVKGRGACNQTVHTCFTQSISGHQLKHMQPKALNRRATFKYTCITANGFSDLTEDSVKALLSTCY